MNYTRLTEEKRYQIQALLDAGLTVTAIAGQMNRHKSTISREAIYRYVYRDKRSGGQLHCHLRCQKSKRRRYGAGYDRRGRLHDRRPIADRPAIVQQRLRIGDWEGDTVLGKRGMKAMFTLVDQVSRTP